MRLKNEDNSNPFPQEISEISTPNCPTKINKKENSEMKKLEQQLKAEKELLQSKRKIKNQKRALARKKAFDRKQGSYK